MKNLDREFLPELPQSSFQRAQDTMEDFVRLYRERGGISKSEVTTVQVLFGHAGATANLSGVGVDRLRITSLEKDKFDSVYGDSAKETRFQFVEVNADLFNDGSPYVLEGDSLEGVEANTYAVLFFPEYPDVMIQAPRNADGGRIPITTEYWGSVQKHYLQPADTEAILSNLAAQRDNIDTNL